MPYNNNYEANKYCWIAMMQLQQWLSRAVMLLTDARVGWLKNLLIRLFIKVYQPKMEEALYPRPEDYESFNDFFARELKPGARPIAAGAIVAPADGRLVAAGDINNNRVGLVDTPVAATQAAGINSHSASATSPAASDLSNTAGDSAQAASIDNIKSKSYSVAALLGLDAQESANAQLLSRFAGGSYATIYLAPQDYHRVHFPCDAKMLQANFIPGYLYSVNDKSCAKRPSLYAYNQRLACICETPHGLLGIVMVAAMIVSRITTAWGREHAATAAAITDNTARNFKQGDELGFFSMGSSVVLLWQQPALLPEPANNTKLRMGQLLYKL